MSSYDLLGHLTQVTRTSGESETLVYAPGGELLYRQVGEKFTFYVGEYATVTASGTPGCGASCVPQAATVEVDAHVVFAGTRIASVKPSRTLYYYRTRLGTVVATSLGGGVLGAGYRYTPYGEVELSVNETEATRSELGLHQRAAAHREPALPQEPGLRHRGAGVHPAGHGGTGCGTRM